MCELKNLPKIRMVCFDVGGVLVKHSRSWREGVAAAGLELRVETETPEIKARRKEQMALLACGRIDGPTFHLRMSELTGGLYTPEQIERIHHFWLGPEYDGVGPVVRRLVEAGRAETGVLSNTNEAHWARIDPGAGVAEFPTASMLGKRFASHLLGLAKPSPEIYARFEELTGFRGSEILFLEDMPENLAAAEARGWTVAPIDYTKETAGQIEGALGRYGLI
jgi:FMN phosphatase YigB (HAD superfamily)